MKTRIWIALPLAAALAMPVVAQENSPSTQSSAPAVQQQQSSSNSSSDTAQQNASGRQPLELQRHEGFWGKINPFARKKYVQRQLNPIKDRVNELDELTAANSKNIKDVDARATEGIRQSMAKANEADQHAVDAGNKAQSAQQTATQASTRIQTVSQVVENLDQYKPVTQTEIRFRPGQAVLSTKAKSALDDMATSLKDQKGYIIEIQGFSAGKGQAAIESSQKMADAVVRYLVVNHDVPVYRVHELGLGNMAVKADDGSMKRVRGGQIQISLLKNDLEQLNTASAEAAPQAGAEAQGGVSGAAASSAPASEQPAAAAPVQSEQPAAAAPAQQPAASSNTQASPATSPNTKKQTPPPVPHE